MPDLATFVNLVHSRFGGDAGSGEVGIKEIFMKAIKIVLGKLV